MPRRAAGRRAPADDRRDAGSTEQGTDDQQDVRGESKDNAAHVRHHMGIHVCSQFPLVGRQLRAVAMAGQGEHPVSSWPASPGGPAGAIREP